MDNNTTTQTKKYSAGNVVFNKVKGRKVVLARDFEDTTGLYEFVCNEPHEDGDYSYLCGSDYCRCTR